MIYHAFMYATFHNKCPGLHYLVTVLFLQYS